MIIISQGVNVFFILLFTYAAATKLIVFKDFYMQLRQSPFIGTLAGLLVWATPAVLILISFLLFFPLLRLVALYCCLILMSIFSLYITSVLNFAESVPCSCGGVLPSLSWNEHLIFNVGCMLLASLAIALAHRTPHVKSERPAY